MVLLESFLVLSSVLLLAAIAWSCLFTTPQERASIRNFSFFAEIVRPAPRCPRCGSHRLRCRHGGFRSSKAVAGVLLTGSPLGANAGLLGRFSSPCTCLDCGCRFVPDKSPQPPARQR